MKITRLFFSIILLMASFVLGGCGEDVLSELVSTYGMYADYSAVSEEEGEPTNLKAMLRVGGNSGTFVELNGEDVLRSYANSGNEKTMSHHSFGVVHSYKSEYDLQTGGTVFKISLDRGDYNLDAEINNLDKNDFWLPNLGSGSQLAE